MKKTSFLFAIASTLLLACGSQSDKLMSNEPNSLAQNSEFIIKNFKTLLDSIRTLNMVEDSVKREDLAEVYVQKVKLLYTIDTSFHSPKLFIGEFISSLPEIHYKFPTYSFSYILMKSDINASDDILLDFSDGHGEKISDTLYFYEEYGEPGYSSNGEKTCYPIAFVTPNNKIELLSKDLFFKQVEKDITSIMTETLKANLDRKKENE